MSLKHDVPTTILVSLLVVIGSGTCATGQDAAVLPASDRTWSGDDYALLAQAITAQQIKPPKITDADGGARFWRMVDQENLSLVRDKSLPANHRVGEAL